MVLRDLADRYGLLRLSPVYRNPAVGFEGDDFLNAVIAFRTEAPVTDIAAALGEIEAMTEEVEVGKIYTGEVVRVETDPPGMGVVFTHLTAYSKQLIERMLTRSVNA